MGGGAKCWGYNLSGSVGDGTTTSRSTPADVSGLSSEVAALAAGGGHTCAVMASGGAKCWGSNQFSQLGHGTFTDRLTPANVLFPAAFVYLPTIFRNYCSDFFDDFSNPGSGWPVGEDIYLRAEYLNGEYRVFTKRAGYLYLFRAPACDRENYVVEVDARWYGSTGNSYGLLFGLTSGYSRYYLFDMNTDFRTFRVYRREPSGLITVVPVTASSAIKSGTASNHLKVTRNGGYFTLEVNGSQVWFGYDSAITGLTGVGLVVSPYNDRPNADARFDNIKVTLVWSIHECNDCGPRRSRWPCSTVRGRCICHTDTRGVVLAVTATYALTGQSRHLRVPLIVVGCERLHHSSRYTLTPGCALPSNVLSAVM